MNIVLFNDNILVNELQDDLVANGTVVRYDPDSPYMFSEVLVVSNEANEKGIKVITHEESYTSGCSFLDMEEICKNTYNKSRRIERGLFKSNSGLLINSDVNGSLQIMMKVFPNAFNERYEIEAFLTPIVINAA